MTRTALLALLLTGCVADSDHIQASYSPVPEFELVDFTWCTEAERRQCALIRQGDELLVMGHPSRIGDGVDVWDVRGSVVDAFSED